MRPSSSLPLLALILSTGCSPVPDVICAFTLPLPDGASRVPSAAGFNLFIDVSGSFTAEELPAVHFVSDAVTDMDLYPEGLLINSGIAIPEEGCLNGCAAGARLETPIDPGPHTITATALTPNGATACQAQLSLTANSPPVISNLVINPEDPQTGDDLTFSFDGSDADGDWPSLVDVTATWIHPSGNELGGDSLSNLQTAVGETWTLELFGRDAQDIGAPSSTSVTIGNTPPAAPDVAVWPQPGRDDAPLHCAVTNLGQLDPDAGQDLSVSYSWSMDGDDGPTSATLPASATTAGDQWICAVTVSDGTDSSEAGTASATILPALSLPTSFDLEDGLTITGVRSTQYVGGSGQLSAPGDVDGDGLADFVLTVSDEVLVGLNDGPGFAYLFSGADPIGADLDSATTFFFGADGYEIGAPAPVGDLSGDGIDDLVFPFRHAVLPLATYNPETLSGGNGVYLLFGQLGGWSGPVDLVMEATAIIGVGQEVGQVPCPVGDLDGDGYNELAISSPGASTGTGKLTVIYGHPTPWLDGAAPSSHQPNFPVVGASAGQQLGSACAGPLDLNGDGFNDLVVNVPGGGLGTGRVLIYYGEGQRWSGDQSSATADVILDGAAGGPGGFGLAMTALPDWDGDGLDDLAISGFGANGGSAQEGAVWIAAGGDPLLSGAVSADALPYQIRGAGELGFCGVLTGLDLNGDGLGDLVCGDIRPALAADLGADVGIRIFLGGDEQAQNRDWSEHDLFLLAEAPDHRTGASLAGLADRDGDDYAELLVGAPGRDGPSTDSGAVYVINFSSP